MSKPLKRIEEAASFWHERIGRHLTTQTWERSLSLSYPCINGSGKPQPMRLGVCRASAVMIDAQGGVLIDKLDLPANKGLAAPDCDFHYGENVKGVTNKDKAQINWALDESRVYPLLLIRPALKSPYECLTLSHTPHQITVCIPAGNYSFAAEPVRRARDYILAHDLAKKWAQVARLRQAVRRNEHLTLSTQLANKVMADYAKASEIIPLDVYLPEPGTGEYLALGEALAEKPAVDISVHVKDQLAARLRA